MPTACVVVSGNYAYVGGYGLAVVDISNPSLPHVVSTMPVSGRIVDMAVSGGSLVAVLQDAVGPDLLYVNVGKPKYPSVVGSMDVTGTPRGVDVRLPSIYVACGSQGVRRIDGSTPANLREIDRYDTAGTAEEVAISGASRVAVADGEKGLVQVEFSFTSPYTRPVTFSSGPGYAQDVAVSGLEAYVTYGDGMYSASLSSLLSSYVLLPSISGCSSRIAMADDHAIVGGPSGISKLTLESRSVDKTYSTEVHDVAVGDSLAAAVSSKGLELIDFSRVSELKPLWTVGGEHEYKLVLSDETTCYAFGPGIHSYSIVDTALAQAHTATDSPGPTAVVAHGPYLFETYDTTVTGSSGFRIRNRARPGSVPLSVDGELQNPGIIDINGMATDNNHVFLSRRSGGLLGVLPDQRPPLLQHTVSTDPITCMANRGSVVFLGHSNSMSIIDMTHPGIPDIKPSFNTAAPVERLAVDGDRAFLAYPGGAIDVVDISNLSAPRVISSLQGAAPYSPYEVTAMEARNGLLYVGGLGSLSVFDATMQAPQQVAHASFGSPPFGTIPASWKRVNDIDVHGSRVYVATQSGVQVFGLDASVGYSWHVDKSAESTPDLTVDTTFGTASLGALADGTWFFHVRGILGSIGRPPGHYRVKVDRLPPEVHIDVVQSSTWGTATVSVNATDAGTGVKTNTYNHDGVQATYSGPFIVTGSWVHTVTAFASDYMGRTTTATTHFSVDTSAPVATFEGPAGWVMPPALVTLRAQDPDGISGVDWISATRHGPEATSTQTYHSTEASMVIAVHGVTTVSYIARDRAGNLSPLSSALVRIDSRSPETTYTPGAYWSKVARRVDLRAVDLQSGVKRTLYSLNSDPMGTYTAPFDVAPQGVYLLAFFSEDNVGNVEQTRTAAFGIDWTPPVTLSNAQAAYETTASITLSAADGVSQVATTYWQFDDSPVWNVGSSASTSAPGLHEITYYSVDNAGNVEAPQHAAFTIGHDEQPVESVPDTLPPVTTLFGNPTTWWRVPVQLVLSAIDGGSGVENIYWGQDEPASNEYHGPFWITHDGVHAVNYRAVDASGNAEATKTAFVMLDQTPPVTLGAVQPSYLLTASISVAPTDALSGVAATFCSVDGGDWSECTSVIVTGTGTHSLTYYSEDWAGNRELAETVIFKVTEVDPPVPPDQLPRTQAYGIHPEWFASPMIVTLVAEDDNDENPTTWYGIDSEPLSLYTGPFALSTEGTTTLRYHSVDASGHVEDVRVAMVRIDSSAPEVSSDVTAAYDSSASIEITATDTYSGVTAVLWQLDGGQWKSSLPVTTSVLGAHTLSYMAVDKAGNASLATAADFCVRADSSIQLRDADTTLTIDYEAETAIIGTLTVQGEPTGGEHMWLESSTRGGPFTRIMATFTMYDGSFVFHVYPKAQTVYRVTLDTSSVSYASESRTFTVRPRAKIGAPNAPTYMYKGRRALVRGGLYPRHTQGSRVVRIYKQHYVKGRWRPAGYVITTLSNYSWYSRYSAYVTLNETGRWRLRAYVPADADHEAAWSSKYDYVRVK